MPPITDMRKTLSQGIDTNRIRFVDDVIDILSWDEVPFLKLIGINGEEVTNPKIEWWDDELLPEAVTNGANAYTGADTSIVLASGDAAKLQKFVVLQTAAGKLLWVTDINPGTDTITVTRDFAGSTAAAIAAGETLQVVGIAVKEGDDSPQKPTLVPTVHENYCQIFDGMYEISHRQQNTAYYGVENDDKYQLMKTTKEQMNFLELAAINGLAQAGTASEPSTMGGLVHFITAANGSFVYDAGVENLTPTMLEDALQECWERVGPDKMGKTVLVPMKGKRKINSIYANAYNVRSQRREKQSGYVVDTLITDFGEIEIVPLFRMPRNTLYVVNLEYIKVHPFKNSRFFDEELSRSGAYIRRHVYGDYTMKVKNVKGMAKIVGSALFD